MKRNILRITAVAIIMSLVFANTAFASITSTVKTSGTYKDDVVVGNTQAVNANGSTIDITIEGNVQNNCSSSYCIYAQKGSTVHVTKDAEGLGASVVVRCDASTVTVDGTVISHSNTKNAIYASKGATVTAGSVEAANNGIKVSEDATTVVVTGDVTAVNNGVVYDEAAPTVVIEGTLTANDLLEADTENLNNSYFYELKMLDGSVLDPMYNYVNYIIKTKGETEAISLSGIKTTGEINGKTYDYANGGNVITVSVKQGYDINSPIATKNINGTYTIIVPNGGGVTIEAIMAAIAAVDTTPANTGSIGSAVTGTWTQNFKGEWFFTTNRQVRNSWAYIADPTGAKEGNWYRFGVNGAMLTGWQEIDGKQYYFIETPGADQGKLLMNAVTPDGKRVGADGVLTD